MSSKVVAEVEHESCGDELLLRAGECRLLIPSDTRCPSVLMTDLPFPLLFSNVGDCELVYIWLRAFDEFFVFSFLIFGFAASMPRIAGSSESLRLFCSVGHVADAEGLGLVAIRVWTLGGEGKAAMLTERRRSPLGSAGAWPVVESDWSVGTEGVDFESSLVVGLGLLGLEEVLWAILGAVRGAGGILEVSEGLRGVVRGFGIDNVGMLEGGGTANG